MTASLPATACRYSSTVLCWVSVTRSRTPHLPHLSRSTLYWLDDHTSISYSPPLWTGMRTQDMARRYGRCMGGRVEPWLARKRCSDRESSAALRAAALAALSFTTPLIVRSSDVYIWSTSRGGVRSSVPITSDSFQAVRVISGGSSISGLSSLLSSCPIPGTTCWKSFIVSALELSMAAYVMAAMVRASLYECLSPRSDSSRGEAFCFRFVTRLYASERLGARDGSPRALHGLLVLENEPPDRHHDPHYHNHSARHPRNPGKRRRGRQQRPKHPRSRKPRPGASPLPRSTSAPA
mmetsp:Transcript_19775/g.48535  ORF Transcript_19775/g.48535 Transcript_19775/m.48535 type:complete len:294 (-) Transcript_19775:43-924(-)